MNTRSVRGLSLGICSNCGKRTPIYFRRYSGVRLCPTCFKEDFIKRVRRTISRYELLRYDDRILVAVSGGKDSLVLLKVLYEIEQDFPRSELLAVLIDEGIDSYRLNCSGFSREIAGALNVELQELSFKDLYGFTLSEVVESGIAEKLKLHPCTICGILRRKALVTAAKRLGATVIATAHTLEDVVQTYLLNLLRGEKNIRPIGLRRGGEGVVPRVAPFRLTPQREVALYAYLEGIPFQSRICPYTHESMRDEIRNFLTLYDYKYPGSLYAFLSMFERILERIPQPAEVNRCEVCGEPTDRRICRACEITLSIKSLLKD
ncbi:MAG: TIGR00269 family protein [Thaumarchaeota archaeon]|nr:MAG: TIGR00269 family protein [Nitrososphaerota archaeon]